MVSAIITTCKRPINVVKNAIESVINQSYDDLEVIVVNDNPGQNDINDEIEEFIENSNHKIVYHKMEANKGACVARNTGVKLAKGEYIAFLDDDDIWTPDKIKLQYDCISHNDNMVMVTGYTRLSNGEIYNTELSGNVIEKLLARNIIGGCSTPLIRKVAFDNVGGFDEKYPSSQDYNLWIKLSKIGEIGFIKSVLVDYADSEDAISHDFEKRITGWKYILEDFAEDYKKYRKAYRNFCYSICEEMIATGYRGAEKPLKYWFDGTIKGGFGRYSVKILKMLIGLTNK